MCYITAYKKLNNDAINSIKSVLMKYRLKKVEFEPITVTLIDRSRLMDEVITGIGFYEERLCISILINHPDKKEKITLLRFADEMDIFSQCKLAEHVRKIRF